MDSIVDEENSFILNCLFKNMIQKMECSIYYITGKRMSRL